MIRFQLTKENEKRVMDAVQKIYEEHGVQISGNRLLNLMVEIIGTMEFHQEVVVSFRHQSTENAPERRPKPAAKQIRRTSSWMSGFK